MAKLGNLYLDGKFPISTNRLNHFDRLFGQALFGGVEKSVDFSPIISVSDALAKPAIDLQCKITAVQEGSGDPSPQNIRNIVGWNGLTLHVNSSEIPVTWQTEAGTVYGGVLDVTTGELTVTHAITDLGSLEWTLLGSGRHTARITDAKIIANEQTAKAVCTQYKVTYASGVGNINYGFAVGLNNHPDIIINDVDLNGTSGTDFQTAMNGVMCVYELATLQTYTLTPQTVALLAGNNTLWNTAGDIKLTYLAKKS